jgi:putative hydrolase of HD superfamily
LNATRSTVNPSLVTASGLLKRLKRTGWLKKAGISSDRESVADHSYRMAIIALRLGLEMEEIDSWKLVRMCLIHDLAEAVMGDILPEEKESVSSHRQEEDKINRRILEKLPPKSRSVLLEDWKELMASKTKEAKLTWQIDKLEMVLQANDYIRMGYDKERLQEFVSTKIDKRLMKVIL